MIKVKHVSQRGTFFMPTGRGVWKKWKHASKANFSVIDVFSTG
jgi:hypothetical protein